MMHAFESRGSHFLFDSDAVRLERLSKKDFLRGAGVPAALQREPRADRPAARAQPPSREVEVLVNAAHSCNLACEYCFVGRGRFQYSQANGRSLEPRLAEKLIEVLPRALPDVDQYCIHFYGGEPLLNVNALRAAVEAAERSSHRFRFAVTTNGTVFEPEVFALLRRAGFGVILSIDGPPSVHDELRRTADGRPTHALVLKFLKRLKREGIFVRGSSVVRRGWPLGRALAYLDSLPVDLMKAQVVRLPNENPLSLTAAERTRYVADLKALAGTVIDGIRRGDCPKDDRFNTRVLQVLSGTTRTAFCGAGRSVFGLAADGTVLPCALLAGFDTADLGPIDEPDLWVQRGRDWSLGHGPRDECRECWALPLCGGGCPAMLSVCGDGECDLIRATCEAALGIYGAFVNRPADLMVLAAAL